MPRSSTSKGRRRQPGEGGLFQRCDKQYGCPDRVPELDEHGEPVLTASGKPKMVRPNHTCQGMWIGVLDLGWIEGNRVRPTVSARTRKAAQEKLNDLKKQVAESGGDVPDRGTTVEQWFPYWLEEVAVLRPGSYADYKSLITKWIVPHLGKLPLEGPKKLGTKHLRQLYKTMGERGAKGRRPTAHAVIRKGLEDARRESPPKVLRNIAKDMAAPPGAGGKRAGHTPADGRKILTTNAHAGDRLASRWDTALMAGLRQGECLGMELDRVDLKRNVFLVSWQLQRLTWYHGCGKPAKDGAWPCGKTRGGSCPARAFRTGDGYEYRQLEGALCLVRPKSESGWRVVPIVSFLRPTLAARVKAIEAEQDSYTKNHGLMWCQPDGRPIDPKHDLLAWKALEREAGVPGKALHEGGRHTTGRLLLEAGVDAHIVQAILGHADKETSRGYEFVDVSLASAALEKAVTLLVEPSSELPVGSAE